MLARLKKIWQLIKITKDIYDWDYSGVIDLEEYQLKCLRDEIDSAKFYEGYERDVERINTMLRLLEISRDNMEHLHMIPDPRGGIDHDWKLTIYVNSNNYKRFVDQDPNWQYAIKAITLNDLRVQKAWYLYNKMRYYWMKNFWV